MKPSIVAKLEALYERHEEVQALLGDAATIADQDRFRALSREYAQLGDVSRCYTDWRQVQDDIETAQMMEELCDMAKKFKAAADRGDTLGLNEDELAFYDALATNEASVKQLGDEILAKIAHELTENLRKSLTVDWKHRESVRATLRLMVKRVLKKYKYPPDCAESAVEMVLEQAKALGEEWS